ncbi:hypothetical protein B0I35DRAFT_415446 [Stachybotrys elegans]|uniref:Uncharacterized protein n=1 Tax=Stachybotrys elegans TaxID=80388 RepID=A0A8K0SC64_9HYPO|nr:hypothetical protein B0I35DRAFT_415446 [Stachybotrys elegans]
MVGRPSDSRPLPPLLLLDSSLPGSLAARVSGEGGAGVDGDGVRDALGMASKQTALRLWTSSSAWWWWGSSMMPPVPSNMSTHYGILTWSAPASRPPQGMPDSGNAP